MLAKNRNRYYYYSYSYSKDYAPGDSQAQLKFQVSEAYKTIRTNLLFSILKNGCKRIVFSSSSPGEGKSTVSVNTAISLAQANSRVLLIDCDLRRPTVHRFFNISNTPGLTNVLGGLNTLEEAMLDTKYPNLKLLCSGLQVPNPSEMLASTQLQNLLDSLSESFDYIIFDTPPLNVVSDAIPLIKNSDGVVLVVREMISTFTDLDKAVGNLQMVDAKILGLVYNGSGTSRANKGGYYHNRYSSYSYAYTSNKKD